MENDNNNSLFQKRSDTAAILHIFYLDLLDELVEKTNNLGTQCDFYISTPNDPHFISKISKAFPDARIISVSNRGRDVLPFIDILNEILVLNYDYLVKVHTKKSGAMVDGKNWRQDVYEKLLGSPEIVRSIKNALKEDPKLGLIGPAGHVLESRFYINGNYRILDGLMSRFGFKKPVPDNFFFSASTMFWCRPEIFKPFLDTEFLVEEFTEEPIPADNTFVHGLERFFGLMTTLQDYKIKTINEEGKISDPKPAQVNGFVPLPTAFRLKEMKTIVFFRNMKDASESEQYRITTPYKLAGIEIIDGISDGEYAPNQVKNGDALILQNKFNGSYADYSKIFEAALKFYKPMIIDVDESIFCPKIDNEDFSSSLFTTKALIDADLLITSTPKLRETLNDINPNIAVFPDYLDDQVWKLKPVKPKNDDNVIITFIGAEKDRADLELIAPVLKFLLIKHAPFLRFELIGLALPKCLEGIPGVIWNALPCTDHKLNALRCQNQKADIFIVPLLNTLYNDCKSPLNFFEHSAMGIPAVYSALTPYKSVISDGIDGFLAYSTTDWIKQLEALILNPTLRYQMAKAAQEKVKKQYLLSNNVHSLNDIFGDVVPDKIVDRTTKITQTNYIQEILQTNIFPSFENLIAELTRTRNALQISMNDVEQYRTSTSWKITQPLRKFSELFRKR